MLNTVVRQIAMLRLIPRHPRKIAVTEIHDRLASAEVLAPKALRDEFATIVADMADLYRLRTSSRYAK